MARTASSVLVLALSALSAVSLGCADIDESELEADAIGDVPEETMGNEWGSGGTNHLSPWDLHPNFLNLYNSAHGDNLAWFNMLLFKWYVKNNVWNNNLLATAGGRSVLEYAVRCGIPDGHKIWYNAGIFDVAVTGQGLMSTITDWKNTPLSVSRTADLFACMAAHLNGVSATVPIFISGPNVTAAEDGEALGYTWDEALFAVKFGINPLNGATTITYHAFPFAHAGCPTIVDGIKDRICDNYGAACQLNVHDFTHIQTRCVSTTTGYYCDLEGSGTYVPMVKTNLHESDVGTLYRGCGT